ncbi:hypothetical protein Ancab_038773 [Ancistrocladus abbreviatus]
MHGPTVNSIIYSPSYKAITHSSLACFSTTYVDQKMVRIRTKFPAFCFKFSKARLGACSRALRSNLAYHSGKTGHKSECSENDSETCFNVNMPRTGDRDTPKSVSRNGNGIMVVIDSSQEATSPL